MVFPASSRAAWELSDLSILFPLPQPGSPNQLWQPNTPAREGVLLPRKVYDELPMIVVPRDREWILQSLRVVAARIDPCFKEGPSPERLPCRRQIRFVWQPMEENRSHWTTIDAAVHSFHELKESEWRKLRADLLKLKSQSQIEPGLPLQVHPLLEAQGVQGAYGNRLRQVLLSYAGPANLIRATAMVVNNEGTVWVFTGFDFKNGKAIRLQIPRTKMKAQAFFANLENPSEYRSRMNPYPEGEAPFLNLLNDSSTAQEKMGEEEIQQAVRSSLRALNPNLSNPGTVDCVSCHAARGIPAWAEEKFPNWNWETIFGDQLFRAPGNLGNTTAQPRRADMLRAFGYMGRGPAISPRTVFETALAAGKMDD